MKNNMKTSNFIMTKDENTRCVLLSHNLIEVQNSGGIYVFVNEPKKMQTFNFEELDFVFTNKLVFEE